MGIFNNLFSFLIPQEKAPQLPQIEKLHKIYSPPIDYTVIDIETSGLDPTRFEVLEIGAIKYRNHEQLDKFQSFVRPKGSIPAEASGINHIKLSMVTQAPTFEEVMPKLLEFVQDDVIVGYNIGFDIKFLQTRAQKEISNPIFDVLWFTRKAFPGLPHYRLDDMRQFLRISGGSHRAVDDCIATVQVYQMGLQTPGGQRYAHEIQQMLESAEWEKHGQPYFEQGEIARKSGHMDEAIRLFEIAKAYKYVYPSLYIAYAKIYRKQIDYVSEIAILDEGIARLGEAISGELIERRQSAQKRLDAKKIAEQEELDRTLRREARQARKLREIELAKEKPKVDQARPVLQMDDAGVVIKEFPSVSAAAVAAGVDPKGIRSAATGRQKHAGGYQWAYKDSK